MSGNVEDPGSAWFGGGERSPAAGPSRNVRLIATAVAVFVSVIGLALFLHLYICHVRRRNRRRAATAATAAVLPTTATDSAAAARKGGLEPSAIAALPTAAYGKVGDAGCSECAICLGAMQEGDAVRVLPACDHVFHVACVDAWLASSSSCPVCRAGVEPPPPPTAAGSVQEKQDVEKEEAGTSAPARGVGASLRKMLSSSGVARIVILWGQIHDYLATWPTWGLQPLLSRERPSAPRPQGDRAVEMEDLERQQPQLQQ